MARIVLLLLRAALTGSKLDELADKIGRVGSQLIAEMFSAKLNSGGVKLVIQD